MWHPQREEFDAAPAALVRPHPAANTHTPMKIHLARRFHPATLIVPAVLALAFGCSRANPFRAVERGIQAELPRLIGPAEQYQVTVSRSSGNLVAGRIPWIDIQGRNVRAIEGLNLDELLVRLEGVRFDRSKRELEAVEQSRFEARLGAASLTRYIQQRSPALRDVRVRFTEGRVMVRATPALLGLGVPVEVTGRPVVRGSTTLHFDADRVAVLRIGLPEFVAQRLEAAINPLVDLAAMSLPVQPSSVAIHGDRAIIAGTAVVKGLQSR
jgi:hypothetical protein